MGKLGIVLSIFIGTREGVTVTTAQVNPGDGPVITCDLYRGVGDDSLPLPGDYVMLVPIQRNGVYTVVAFLDPNASQAASPGERRVYARDSGGAEKVSMWLKNDGSAVLSNDSGNITLNADGSVSINGAIISPTGEIKDSAEIVVGTHTHNFTDADGNPKITEEPNP